jgi:DNA-binding transcriptional regulator YiaG
VNLRGDSNLYDHFPQIPVKITQNGTSKLMIMITVVKASLGQRIRQRRESLGLSRHKLAVACDVTENSVTNWENDKHLPKLAPKQLIALLAMLQWELQDLAND